MSKQQSVAPKERVNITYKSATGDAQEEVELPLKILTIGDYSGKASDAPIEERKAINIDKDNFDQVLAEHDLSVDMTVPDHLSGEEGAELAVHLDFESMKDFGPEAIADRVPELAKLLELRAALTALKGPLGNVPAFRKRIQSLLSDDDARKALIQELGLDSPTDGGE